jgi:proline iminopeptidase
MKSAALFIAFLSLCSPQVQANCPVAMSFPTPQNYLNGHQICEKFKAIRENEPISGYLPVPIDYFDRSKGTTDLYWSLEYKFDPKKPTVIFFRGGPGSGIHDAPDYSRITNNRFNFIYFDQRGINCSRPMQYATFMDPRFYSTENTARDAHELINYFQLDKAILYGSSYGTVAATVTANLFPNSVSAVVLEGTVGNGRTLWRAPYFWSL